MINFKFIGAILAVFILCLKVNAQPGHPKARFNRQDTLRGSITPEREWWQLTYYHLDVEVFPSDSNLSGSVTIHYRVLEPSTGTQVEPFRMQVDLQSPMQISKVMQNGEELDFVKDGNAWFITMHEEQQEGELKNIIVSYQGKPKVSRRPPWDGGFTWTTDEAGKPFIATANQGDGASLWWPCKDHMYQEADSMLITVTTPKDLKNVSNGSFRGMKKNKGGTKTWSWFVSNPISNYVINLNIANYAHFGEVYDGELGSLNCDYYVLKENITKAKEQFKQVPMMLEAFEHWFGPYPFYEDGFKLVEVPYPGMEHQSSVTYGNGYENGFGGRDVSRTGWGDKFDFIIIHESGHEWFANNITYRDMADMWIHESFTAYSEGLYVEYHYGKDAGFEYLRGVRSNIRNDRPIIGHYDVNHSGSGDMYPKGANMLHTIRQLVDDDEKWRGILRGLNKTFWHQVVTTSQIEDYMNENTDMELSKIFDQYLRDTRIPTFEYRFNHGVLSFRWTNCIRGFDMPLRITLNGEEVILEPKSHWSQKEGIEGTDLVVDKDFYISVLNAMGE
ncbi:MAG TPA: M1 family peptidase [Bacteroides sp.]|nr:M1 family peptidase [Bacteroides sp.]